VIELGIGMGDRSAERRQLAGFASLRFLNVHLVSEGGGKNPSRSPAGKSVSFRVRVVRASGRGEAARGREAEMILTTLGRILWRCPAPSRGCTFSFLLLYAWVLKKNRPGACYMHGYLVK